MDDLLNQLEGKLRALVQKYDHLKLTNMNLRHQQTALSREKDLLVAKNKVAITQIEHMVSRLKSIENVT